MEQIQHITQNGKYSVRIEKAASANKSIGWKVEVNGDNMAELMVDVRDLVKGAELVAKTVPVGV